MTPRRAEAERVLDRLIVQRTYVKQHTAWTLMQYLTGGRPAQLHDAGFRCLTSYSSAAKPVWERTDGRFRVVYLPHLDEFLAYLRAHGAAVWAARAECLRAIHLLERL